MTKNTLIFLCLLIFANITAQNLVLHYNFDNCSATDLSGNNRNGTFLNNPTCTTSPLNQALALNLSTATSCGAGSYVKVPSFDPIWSQGITVCAWVDFGNVTTGERFIDFNTPASNSYVRFGREGNTNNLLVEKRFDEVYSVTSASNTIRNNQYAYYCMTISNSMVKIYINGSLVVQNAVTATNPIGNIRLTDCYLGRSWSYCERDFEGKIDDIKVYNRPLSDVEIQSAFTSSITIQSLTVLDNYTNTVITNASLYKTWLKRVRIKAQTSLGELILDQNLFTKTSSNPSVVAFESDGRFRGVADKRL